jgi:Tfp pilus assembly protein PilO
MPKKKKNKTEFFQKFWVKATGVIISITGLIGIGVQVGAFKGEIDCKVERMQIIEKYQEKLAQHDKLCEQVNIEKIESEINDINEVIKYLKKGKDEK